MHFHDSWWAFPLMVCKSLEHQTSYFCGLNGSGDAQMLQKKKSRRREKESDKGCKGGKGWDGLMTQYWLQEWMQAPDLPTGSCLVTFFTM